MPGRNYTNGTGYRYGFNGKENDPEVTSTGKGTQDYGFRIYNPAVGRFLSIDPLTDDYPFFSPYQFAGNDPTNAIDLDGLEPAYQKADGTYVTAKDGDLQSPISQQGANYIDTKTSGASPYIQGTFEALVGKMFSDIVTPIFDAASQAIYGQDLDGNEVSTGSRFKAGIDLITYAEAASGKGGKGGAPKNMPKLKTTTSVKPNGGNAKPHGSPKHNTAIDNKITNLKQDKSVTNIRKNQQQVDVNGKNVGKNRPDIQYDQKGTHVNHEIDTKAANSKKHGIVIKQNDPNSKIKLDVLK